MNFVVIFLCLFFGAVVGYEFGKWSTEQRFNRILRDLAENIKKAAETMKKNEKKELMNDGEGA